VQKKGNPLLAVFSKKDELSDPDFLIIFLVSSKEKKDDLLCLKIVSPEESFIVLERSERYKQIEAIKIDQNAQADIQAEPKKTEAEIKALEAEEKAKEEAKNSLAVKQKKWGDRWYVCKIDNKYAGYLYVKPTATGNESMPITFSHKIIINNRGSEIYQDLFIHCNDNTYFSPIKIICKGKGTGKGSFPSFVSSVSSNGILNANLHGVPFTVEISKNTILFPIIFDVVQQLPLSPETKFEYNSLEIEIDQLLLRKKMLITYHGKEEIFVEAEKMNLHKFVQTGENTLSSFFWVDDNQILYKAILNEDMEFSLTTKAKAIRGN
jgi:hypothetical protein